ncbi:MAG TPA: hypothetical protein VNA20_09935 [Frankiaceae bacterium]|nr:hypothetical protein [Frankiaceae bacterium]
MALLLLFATAASAGYAGRTLVAPDRRWVGAAAGFFCGLFGLTAIWLAAGRSAAPDARRRAAWLTALAVALTAAALWTGDRGYADSP